MSSILKRCWCWCPVGCVAAAVAMLALLVLAVAQLAGCPSGSAFASPAPGSSDAGAAAPRLEVRVVRAASLVELPLAEQVERMMQAPVPPVPEVQDSPGAVEAAGPASPAFTLLYQTILGLHPEWRPDTCDHPFVEASTKVVCERTRDRGQKWAGKLAFWIYTEASRPGAPIEGGYHRRSICRPSDPLCYVWFAGQGQRESGLSQGDICKVVLRASWVEEVPADAELNTRVRMCWRRGNGGRNCQKVYLRAHNDREYVVDRCAYGEVGVFQVRSHEARNGQIIPASGVPLPASWTERRELLLEPWWNISLAFEAFRVARDWCCGEDQVCLSTVGNWLGVYNTGKCRGSNTVRYVDRIGRALVKAMKYTCSVLPDMTFGEFGSCNPVDMANVFTPPGHPRRHRTASSQ